MPLHFAYGSNMDVEAMRLRCPGARPVCAARLMRHRFVIMPEGYASIVRDAGAVVHGVLWDLALADLRALDAYENVSRGLYSKIEQPVLKAAGGSARGLVYVGRNGGGGAPLPGYMGAVLAAARHWALPEAYVRELARLTPAGEQRGERAPLTEPPKVRPRFVSPLDRR